VSAMSDTSTIYLHDIPLPDAQNRFHQALKAAGLWQVRGIEQIGLDENALGRVLAEPVWARLSSPHYHASAMDGFAVRGASTVEALPSQPVTLAVPGEAVYLDTGDPLPEWADAVIPIEDAEPVDQVAPGGLADQPARDARRPAAIHIRAAVTPWSHVRTMGEDIVATQLVLPAGHVLRPVDLGALAACGQDNLRVARKPRVGILPTGSELVPVGVPPKAGDIIEYNSIVLAAQVESWGGEAVRFPITPDDFDAIRQQVCKAVEPCDLILLNAGSSAGSEDFSARVIASLGKVLVHGVAVRPGHPVIIGMLDCMKGGEPIQEKKAVPILGVPGYPVSAALTGEIFVEQVLARWLGRAPLAPIEIPAALTRKVTSPAGDDDYLRVAVGWVGDRLLAAPLSRGAGVITSLVRADGLVLIPSGTQGLEAGTQVSVRLYRSPMDLEQTIFTIGSHDLTLDLLAQYLAEHDRRLVSVNTGSLGGLVALRREEAHFAGSHLLDPQTGIYNLTSISQYLPGIPVRVVEWVGRTQGLLIRKGNPRQITSLQDLVRPDVRFVNRQRGSGTRVLLDYHLGGMGISPEAIQGYSQEEYTHLAVAAAVQSGRADCGLGIAAAAKALDLDFVPLFDEQYHLVIPRRNLVGGLLDPLFKVAQSPAFRKAVSALPGYDVSAMGQILVDLEG